MRPLHKIGVIAMKKLMFDQLSEYKEKLEDILAGLEKREPVSESAQDRLDERINMLQNCIDMFEELDGQLSEYQEQYGGLGKI